MKRYRPVIGLEIHVELETKSKMFCACSASYFGKKPNTHCCPVCLGLPGALPVPNKKAIEWCVMLGLCLNCEIPLFSKFDRKNYFYPDLPKGYQISQYDKPFAINGKVKLKSNSTTALRTSSKKSKADENKIIRIRRVHMEEDTAKLTHAKVNGKNCTLIDFNRSGVPLVEIVTQPDITNSEEARVFLKKLHQIIRYLGISDADMEKGSMRLEPNISLLATNSNNKLPNYKVEVKNINSFKFVKKAIDYEIERQKKLLEKGITPSQETRGWDEKKGKTYLQRSKEEAHDYRYFPEPDIPPIQWETAQIDKIKSLIVELPDEKIDRLIKDYGLSNYDAGILTSTPDTAQYFEKACKKANKSENQKITVKVVANWIINKKVNIKKTSSDELIKRIQKAMQKPTISEEELKNAVKETIKENEKAVQEYKSGKTTAIMFLVGQVMRKLKGNADANEAKKMLEKLLG